MNNDNQSNWANYSNFLSKKYLDFYYQNVRGLRTKTKSFYLSTLSCNHDIIALTETNLCPSVNDAELFDTGKFMVYRVDRSSLNSPHAGGGGVLVAVRSFLSSEKINVPGTENVEIVFVKINTGVCNIYVCCMYVPSGSPVSVYCLYAEAIEKFFQFITLGINDSVFVTGDLNMGEVAWTPDPDKASALLPGVISSSGYSALTYSILGSNLSQVNHILNPQGKILDLVFCTDPDNVTIRKSLDTLSRVDFPFHEATEFRFTFADHRSVKPNVNAFYYDFKNADYNSLTHYLSRIEWTDTFSNCPTVEDSIDAFYELLLSGLEQFVPVLLSKSCNHPPWYTREIIILKNRRNRAHKSYANSTDNRAKVNQKAKFVILNKEFQRISSNAYDRYIKQTESDLIRHPKKFWFYVDSKRKTNGFPSTMSFNGVKASSPENICKLFSEFFQTVYISDSNIWHRKDCRRLQLFVDKGRSVPSLEKTRHDKRLWTRWDITSPSEELC